MTGTSTTIYIGKLYEEKGGNTTKFIFAGGTKIASKTSTDTYYYHQDHLGSSSVITNSNGVKVEEIRYYPFGETLTDEGSVSVSHKYTSQELDIETGLYYYNARYYDPVLGRFISADPIVPDPTNPQSLNRYSYVLNNPLKYTDPSGHGWFSKVWKNTKRHIIAGVAGVVAAVATKYNAYVGFAVYSGVYSGLTAAHNDVSVFRSALIGVAVGVSTYISGYYGSEYGIGDRGAFWGSKISVAIAGSYGNGRSRVGAGGGNQVSANTFYGNGRSRVGAGGTVPWHGKPNLPYHIQNPNLKPNRDAFNNIYNPIHNWFSEEVDEWAGVRGKIREMFNNLSVDEKENIKREWKDIPGQFSPMPLIPFQPKRNGSSQNESNEGYKERDAFRKRHMKHGWFEYR